MCCPVRAHGRDAVVGECRVAAPWIPKEHSPAPCDRVGLERHVLPHRSRIGEEAVAVCRSRREALKYAIIGKRERRVPMYHRRTASPAAARRPLPRAIARPSTSVLSCIRRRDDGISEHVPHAENRARATRPQVIAGASSRTESSIALARVRAATHANANWGGGKGGLTSSRSGIATTGVRCPRTDTRMAATAFAYRIAPLRGAVTTSRRRMKTGVGHGDDSRIAS